MFGAISCPSATSNSQLKLKLGKVNKATLTWDRSVTTPMLSMKLENGVDSKTVSALGYTGSFDALEMLSISSYEVRREDANPAKRRIRIVVDACGCTAAFTLSDV